MPNYRARLLMPLGENERIPERIAMKLVGKKSKFTHNGEELGVATVTQVDYRGGDEVYLEMEIETEQEVDLGQMGLEQLSTDGQIETDH